ncbi:MAG: class I SAM-dependent methyltransferase [Pseudomonadota bacterium]
MSEHLDKPDWHTDSYHRHVRYVSELGSPVVELLNPQPGELILDLGCGDGALTEVLAGRQVDVLGLDADPSFVASAQARGLDVVHGDGQDLPFEPDSFDAVFSNAALHWMPDADGVLRGVGRVLKPGGRFVGEFGGHGNVAAVTTALRAILYRYDVVWRELGWFFPTAEAYRERLERHGFAVGECTLFSRPTPLPTDISGWLSVFAEGFVNRLDPSHRETAVSEIVELLEPALCNEQGQWHADYVRLRFMATKLR